MQIGIVGGGQLARMMLAAGIDLGIDLRVFAESADSSAKPGVSTVGDYRDFEALSSFASEVDLITFDHEHVPLEYLVEIQKEGVHVFPTPDALVLSQDKIAMRRRMSELDVPQPRWAIARTSDNEKAIQQVGGFPCVAKKPVGGYDGKGFRIINSLQDCADWIAEGEVLLEELVPFTRELSQLSARRPSGEWSSWPLVETRQVGGVCAEVIAGLEEPDGAVSMKTLVIAERIASGIDVVGVLAVELFETAEGEILVNELAMRPHNSGHVLTELSRTSQFEQHLRAVADVPLGATDFVAPFGVMTNVFGAVSIEGQSRAWEEFPQAKIHSYQKEARPGRKVGHVVVVGSDLDIVLDQARKARDIVQGAS